MHHEISESFWLGVEVFGTVIILMFTLSIASSSRQLNNLMEQQNATAQILQDTREWKAYDNTHGLYEADVLSVYYKYGSNNVSSPKRITVDGHSIKGVSSDVAISMVRADKTYSCTIIRDKTLVVTDVRFVTE